VFQRKGSSAFWIAYYRRGKEIRESAKSDNPKVAEKLLKQRLKEVGAEQLGLRAFVGPKADRIVMSELFEALVEDYKIRGRNTIDFASHLKPIRAYFDDLRARDVTEDLIDRFINECLTAGKSPATIDRETQLLGQAFRLAVARKQLATGPTVRRLGGGRVRQDFFERPEFERLISHLPEDLRDFTRFAFLSGWRKGEIASLERADVDVPGRIIRLRGEHSKNGEPRKLALEGELWEIVQRRLKVGETITDTGVTVHPLVFHRADGSAVGDFRKAWASACKAAGIPEREIKAGDGETVRRLPGKHFHGLRRTAARNLIRAGVSESVAMRVTGHRTRSMFTRYNISTESDLREAVRKTEAYVQSLPAQSEHGQNTDNRG
jgi:integrase